MAFRSFIAFHQPTDLGGNFQLPPKFIADFPKRNFSKRKNQVPEGRHIGRKKINIIISTSKSQRDNISVKTSSKKISFESPRETSYFSQHLIPTNMLSLWDLEIGFVARSLFYRYVVPLGLFLNCQRLASSQALTCISPKNTNAQKSRLGWMPNVDSYFFKFSFFLFFLFPTLTTQASDLIFKSRVATVLNTVTLYPDSSYFTHSNIRFSEGELLEVLGETVLEHLDDAQNQKFKWFKVRSQAGEEGWIFGDGIAVVMNGEKIHPSLKSFHKQKITLNNGFEKSVTWVAAVEGRDNLHDNEFLNSTYHEYYLVITNEHGQSVHINYESQSAMGRKGIQLFQMKDVTGDKILDFLLQTNSYSSSSDLENRVLEIFSIQSGSLRKVLNERMTLTYDDDLISPAMYKYVEVSNQSVRVEFVDYVPCKKYSLPFSFPTKSQTQERCMEFVTYTYAWDLRKKTFVPFYKENRNALKGLVTKSKIFLKSEPSFLSEKIEALQPNVPFVVIQHFEKIFKSNGKTKISPYLYVQSASGRRGYIRGKGVRFLNTEHTAILGDFYQKPPLSKTELKTERQFLKIVGINESEETSTVSQFEEKEKQ